MSAAKSNMTDNMTEFQKGTKKGHRPDEHVFVLSSFMALCEDAKTATVVQLMNFSKLFDREVLIDCLYKLYKNKIRGKLYRLFFIMNEENNIQVMTPLGLTKVAKTGSGLGQGGLDSAFLSGVGLDNGVKEVFKDSRNEASYGTIPLNPMLYFDDISRLAKSLHDAQAGLIKLEQMAESKMLDYNRDKTCAIIIGEKKARKRLEKEIELHPLQLYGEDLKTKTCDKYLGWNLNGESISKCSQSTIERRKGNVLKSIFKIQSIIEDSRCEVLGGVSTAVMIWERAVIPFLLFSSKNWIRMSKESLKILTDLQNTFLRAVFSVASSCPIPIMLFDTKTLSMELRIMQRKLNFAYHLANLPETSLGFKIYNEMRIFNLPGLHREIVEFICELGLKDIENYTLRE